MKEIIVYLFATAGATFIVVFSTLFTKFRELFELEEMTAKAIEAKQRIPNTKEKLKLFFGQLFGCPLCLGFWMGAVISLLLGFRVESLSDGAALFVYACAGSAASFLFYKLVK